VIVGGALGEIMPWRSVFLVLVVLPLVSGSSALYASLLGIAALPGLFTMGTLSDRLLRRGIGRKVVFASGILCMAILTALMG